MAILKENSAFNVGIDVGKSQLDIYVLERDRHFIVENSLSGIGEALKTQ